MTREKRKDVIEYLIGIIHRDILKPSAGKRKELGNAFQEFRRKCLELLTELYDQHFSDEQLKVMYDFYSSDIGKSIHETQSLIGKELSTRLKDLGNTLENKGSNRLGVKFQRRNDKKNEDGNE